MKIISWNINGYRSVTGQNPSRRFDKVTHDNKLFPFIESEKPDIICLQETKADREQILPELQTPEGYFGYYHSCRIKKGYSGVVTFTKSEPLAVNYHFGDEKFDIEGRLVETDHGDFSVLNIYFPKGETESERLNYKLEFYDFVTEYFVKQQNSGKKLIISGDFNTAHHEIDLARPKENINTSGFLPIEREKLDALVEKGFRDSFRLVNSESGHYSWWSNRGGARQKNIGWRIDYHFISESLAPRVKNAYILPDTHGSDHCPVVLELE